ncbi:MAG: hypothetical protein WAL59_00165 [Roseiarcus sp.]
MLIFVMAGLVPAIHVDGPPILQEIVDWVARHGEMAANLFHFSSWTAWMAGTSPAKTASIDSTM